MIGFALAGSSNGFATPECGTSDIFENRKEPIAFVQIPMVNPSTGEEYHPNDIITVEINGVDKDFKASEYFSNLNETEEVLNQWGYSIRDGGDATLGGWTQCQDLWEEQGKKIKKNIRDELAKYLLGDEDWTELWDKIKEEYDKNYPDWDELYRQAEDGSYEVNLPPVPTFEASKPTITRQPVEFTKEKTWSWEGGDKSKVHGGLYPYLKFGATKVEAKGEAGISIKVGLAGQWDGELLDVKLSGHSPGTGPLKVDLSASVIDGKKKWNKPLVAEGELKWDERYMSALSKSVRFDFSIGPVPMAAEFGLRGEMGVLYGLALYPLQIGAYTTPYAAADAYAQVGVDIKVASFGVGGLLQIVSLQMPIQGHISFVFEEEPLINLNLAATSELTMLSGNLYAYVKINYLFDTWEGRYPFYEWEGYKKTGTIFDYSAKINRNGLIADGDLTPEDILEMDYNNRLRALEALEEMAVNRGFEVAEAIAQDAASPAAREVAQKAVLTNQLSDSHDQRLNDYYDELREFLN